MSEFQCAIQFKECMRRSMKYTEADMRCSLASSAWMGPRTTSLRGGSSASTVALVGQTLRFNSKACLERNANRLRTRNLILQDWFCDVNLKCLFGMFDLTFFKSRFLQGWKRCTKTIDGNPTRVSPRFHNRKFVPQIVLFFGKTGQVPPNKNIDGEGISSKTSTPFWHHIDDCCSSPAGS